MKRLRAYSRFYSRSCSHTESKSRGDNRRDYPRDKELLRRFHNLALELDLLSKLATLHEDDEDKEAAS